MNEDGLTAVVMPARLVEALYVSAELPTFVTLRVTVWMPARSPIAIDG